MTNNVKSKYEVGTIHKTPKGDVEIIGRVAGSKKPVVRHPRIIIRVLKTGTIIDIQQGNLINGKFSDYREPTVYGVGYIGSKIVIPMRGSNSTIRKAYDLWANMLKRAYGNYKTSYNGVSVDPRWHDFTNFLNSIQELEGYSEWEKDTSMCLDKDIKGNGSKVYSKDSCMFVPSSVNIKEGLNRRWHGSSDTM